MKKSLTYNAFIGCIIMSLCCSVSAQKNKRTTSAIEATKRIEHYQELKKMGYSDKAIYEDLGNANFLVEKYDTAVFWYDKLKDVSKNGVLSSSYQLRYEHAKQKTSIPTVSGGAINKDWLAMVQADYQLRTDNRNKRTEDPRTSKYRDLAFLKRSGKAFENELLGEHTAAKPSDVQLKDETAYQTPITLTPDGNTAYFTKSVYVKPEYGVFSKKELLHKIYKADKVNGEWKNFEEVKICPKYASAMHPSLSSDGTRLFFASNMPGSFGKYDIYVSTVNKDGSLGVAKNLGKKVNTKKNDLYPNLAAGNTLFFASEGRKGYGGLDVYMAQVGRKKVDWSVNMGSEINSKEDDFSILLQGGEGVAYVMSNRGKDKGSVQPIAFNFENTHRNLATNERDYNVMEALNKAQIDYSSTMFEDE